MRQQVNDIAEVLRGLSAKIESMQKTIDSQHATICQINRTSQGHLKEIRDLKRMLKKKDKENEELRKRLSKLLLSGKKRQNHIFSTNIISYTCFTKKGLSFEAM